MDVAKLAKPCSVNVCPDGDARLGLWLGYGPGGMSAAAPSPLPTETGGKEGGPNSVPDPFSTLWVRRMEALCDRLSPVGCLLATQLVATAKIKMKRVCARLRVQHPNSPFPRARFQQAQQVCADAAAGKSGVGIEPFKSIPTDCSPSRDSAFRFGNPYFQVTKLLLHSGACQPHRPALGIGHGHRPCRERNDRVSPKFKEPIGILQRGRSVSDFHGAIGPTRGQIRPHAAT